MRSREAEILHVTDQINALLDDLQATVQALNEVLIGGGVDGPAGSVTGGGSP